MCAPFFVTCDARATTGATAVPEHFFVVLEGYYQL
jgi:hypothetical protein